MTHRRLLIGDSFRGSEAFQSLSPRRQELVSDSVSIEACTVGMPAEPLDFLARAVQAGHPRGMEVHVDKIVHQVIMENFHQEPDELAAKRIRFFKKWNDRARLLDESSDRFLQLSPPHAKQILKGKRLQLWHEILCDLGYTDEHLIGDIAHGFGLTGWLRKSGSFAVGVKRPAFSRETLIKLSNGLNRATLKSLDRRQDRNLEEGTWSETVSEVEKGWIWEDISGNTNGRVIAKRFGIQQGSKLRVIDDCTCGGLNNSVGLSEKFQLHSIDQMASMIAHSFTVLDRGNHPKILGRTYDLRSAYKQFPISERDRDLLRIAVNRPGASSPSIFGVNALPFGAVGSVAGFLRISHSLWYIGTVGLGLCWTAFYDDFSVLTRDELLHSTASACELLFRLLGVDFADSGKKDVPFSRCFKMLGLVVNTEGAWKGSVAITHTDERRLELTEALQTVLDTDMLSPKNAERLRGRMVLFEGYTFGRVANAAVKNLGRLSLNQNIANVLEEDLKTALRFLIQRVKSAEPVHIEKCLLSTWLALVRPKTSLVALGAY